MLQQPVDICFTINPASIHLDDCLMQTIGQIREIEKPNPKLYQMIKTQNPILHFDMSRQPRLLRTINVLQGIYKIPPPKKKQKVLGKC